MIKYFDRREMQSRKSTPWYWGYAWRRVNHDQIIMILIPFNVFARWCYQFLLWLRYPPGFGRDIFEERSCLQDLRREIIDCEETIKHLEQDVKQHSEQITNTVEPLIKLTDLVESHIRESR